MRGLGQKDGLDLSFKVSSVTLFGLNLQFCVFFCFVFFFNFYNRKKKCVGVSPPAFQPWLTFLALEKCQVVKTSLLKYSHFPLLVS